MKNLLMTTMLIVPLGAGTAFAQETTAEEVGEAAGEAVETTVEGLQEGAEAAGDAVEGAVDEVETEPVETEVQVVPADEAEAEAEVDEVETEPVETEVQVVPADEGEAEAEEEVAQTQEPASEAIVREQAQNELRVDWITGTTVRAPDDETIGKVNDLILDGETGELTAAILSVGGFLGIGAKQIAVGWSELEIDYDANEISMNLTREEADAAPEYVFREREQPPAPVPAETGAIGTTGTVGDGTAPGTTGGVAPSE